MHPRDFFARRNGFTLIELLVVIAIIAILAVVVVLTLNPAQLLAQSRDANRVSDMATINSAIGLYQTDTGGTGFAGTSTVVYTSLADNSSSTCGSLGLPPLPLGDIYDCSPSTSTRLINSQGWIPIDFTKISSGAPLGSLPIDPVNTFPSGFFYTYYTNGSQFELTAIPESQKQKTAFSISGYPPVPFYPDLIANGSSLSISPIYNPSGLVGWWPLNEGTNAVAYDKSGNNNNGTWIGTPSGQNSTYYTSGAKAGNSYGGFFDGAGAQDNYISLPSSVPAAASGTIALWVNPAANGNLSVSYWISSGNAIPALRYSGNGWAYFNMASYLPGTSTYYALPTGLVGQAGSWYFVSGSWNANGPIDGTGKYWRMTINGTPYYGGPTVPWTALSTTTLSIGGLPTFPGIISDARIYNRVLSLAEIQAIYNAEK